MEYLLVKFREKRDVFIDGNKRGSTNEVIELEAGTYTITLSPGYTPDKQDVSLQKTAELAPKVVQFD